MLFIVVMNHTTNTKSLLGHVRQEKLEVFGPCFGQRKRFYFHFVTNLDVTKWLFRFMDNSIKVTEKNVH